MVQKRGRGRDGAEKEEEGTGWEARSVVRKKERQVLVSCRPSQVKRQQWMKGLVVVMGAEEKQPVPSLLAQEKPNRTFWNPF